MIFFPEVAHLFVNPALDNVYIDLDVQDQIRIARQNNREQRHLALKQQVLTKTGEVSGRMLDRQIQTIRDTIQDISSKTRNLRSVEVGHQRSHNDICTLISNERKCWRIPTHTLQINMSKHFSRLDPYSMRSEELVRRSKRLPPLKTHHLPANHNLTTIKPLVSTMRSNPLSNTKMTHTPTYIGPSQSHAILHGHVAVPRKTHNTTTPNIEVSPRYKHGYQLPALKEQVLECENDPFMNRRCTIRRADVIHQSLKALYHQRLNYQGHHPKV